MECKVEILWISEAHLFIFLSWSPLICGAIKTTSMRDWGKTALEKYLWIVKSVIQPLPVTPRDRRAAAAQPGSAPGVRATDATQLPISTRSRPREITAGNKRSSRGAGHYGARSNGSHRALLFMDGCWIFVVEGETKTKNIVWAAMLASISLISFCYWDNVVIRMLCKELFINVTMCIFLLHFTLFCHGKY